MSSRPPVVEAAAAAAATLVAWRLLRYYLTPDPYSKLPGPPPESWANGESPIIMAIAHWPLT
jgi:hypothetical protein